MIKCLIVDDAPVARDILVEYCKLLPELLVVGLCGDAFEARGKLLQMPVDLLFLDVNLPLLSGINLLKTLQNPPSVIFTTAYKEFATDAFDLAACDYLVKPFSIERFMVAIDRAKERMQGKNRSPLANESINRTTHLLIPGEGIINQLSYDQILFLEASRNNTKVITREGCLLSTLPLSSLEKRLPAALFSKVHRSFIVNRSQVTSLQGNRVFIHKYEIPLGNLYKSNFLTILGITN